MGAGQRGPPVRSATGRPQPNQALEPTPSSVRCAPAFRRGSPRLFGVTSRRAKPCVHRPRHPGAALGSIAQATIAPGAVRNGLAMVAYINHLRYDIRQRGRRE
jgi:hypothetical protein